MFGIAIEDLKHKNIAATSIGADLFDRIRDPARKGLSGIKSVVNTWIPVGKEWKAFQIRIIPLVFSWGDKGILVEFEDRTDGMMAEEENALLADLVDASPARYCCVRFQREGPVPNKKNLNLLGYSLAEFLELDSSRINIPGSARQYCGTDKGDQEWRRGNVTRFFIATRMAGHIPLEIHARSSGGATGK